jgi:excisionase family DNA binding protein
MSTSPWLTRAGVAEYLGINIQTVDNMAADGRLTKHVIGRVVRFHRAEIDAAMMGAR